MFLYWNFSKDIVLKEKDIHTKYFLSRIFFEGGQSRFKNAFIRNNCIYYRSFYLLIKYLTNSFVVNLFFSLYSIPNSL